MEKRSQRNKCYFCGDVPYGTDSFKHSVELWDGRCVGCCVYCHGMITDFQNTTVEGKHHTANQSQVRWTGGENRELKIEKGEVGSSNIKVAFVLERRIMRFTITDEGLLKTYEGRNPGDKPVEKLILGIKYDGQRAGDPTTWALNNKSRNALIDIFGDQTEKWVGKVVEINISGEGEFKHLIIDQVRTK